MLKSQTVGKDNGVRNTSAFDLNELRNIQTIGINDTNTMKNMIIVIANCTSRLRIAFFVSVSIYILLERMFRQIRILGKMLQHNDRLRHRGIGNSDTMNGRSFRNEKLIIGNLTKPD